MEWHDKHVCVRILKAYLKSQQIDVLSYSVITGELVHAVVKHNGKAYGIVFTGSDERPAVFMDAMIFIGKPLLCCTDPTMFINGAFETTVSGVYGTQIVRVQ